MRGLVPRIPLMLALASLIEMAGTLRAFTPVFAGYGPAMTKAGQSAHDGQLYFRFVAARFLFRAKACRLSARALAFFFRQAMHLQPTALMKQSKYPRP
jgi:hypothetical protein